MSFKLIAIHPLVGCDDDILKILSEDQIYFFDNSYYLNEFGIIEQTSQKVPKDFFYVSNETSSLENINVQALVGKNGEGKSSLIELLIRILNNFFKQYQIGAVTKQLIFAKGVYADLYYQIKKNIYRIHIDSRKIEKRDKGFWIVAKVWENEKIIYDSTALDTESISKRKVEFIPLESLFFTMYINYSIYGLNEADYSLENNYMPIEGGFVPEMMEKVIKIQKESWLTQIFHKNDGYQTPIVLHPFREEGQIDVNNEKYLLSQRLLSLIIEENSSNYHITEDLVASNVSLLFKDKDALDEYINIPIRQIIESNDFSKVESILKQGRDTLHRDETISLLNNYYNFIYENIILLNKFKNTIQFYNNDSNTDLLMINIDIISRLININGYNIVVKERGLQFYLQEIKQYLPEDIYEKVKFILINTDKLNFNVFNLFQIFSIYFNFWINYFNIDKNNLLLGNIDLIFERNLFYYIVTKSFKIIRYPKYRSLNRIDTIEYFSAKLNLSEITINTHTEFLKKLTQKDESHISIKIRQSINVLRLALKSPESNLISFYKGIIGNPNSINFKRLKEYIEESKENAEPILFLPPRVFLTEIFLKSISTNKDNINIKKISSGEYQKNAIISSLIYHLKNIDSIESQPEQNSDALKAIKLTATYSFENIYILLDEIELYFHPEYQRLFINELLLKISKIKFKNLKNINFLFVTHSPFILSDIPKNNVLFLEKGKPIKTMNEDTFASNIHTLLQHGFFLNSVPIGEFAKDKINHYFKLLHEGQTIDEMGKDIYNQLLLVGEPFIKAQLLKLYNDLTPEISDLRNIVQMLDKEIKNLQKQLNDKN
ncbi:AAA family ATPase [Chryseobacterium rhizosphaerae]|uniref:Energy-coupling factor transporter ATP-binding protein EcfA2 n=1 Tax=Chryseobacterium rhizosphaerae TaxID=395937 RepID=A0AAE3YBQ1_9FLAO|nr:hypothetical protein [Chryseobacterium rhizosphaerae]MDR6527211.1 energy-coupling factor transporter ATP-binding protein EcfA2 [Chryseobacterium rhizosphaerae]